MRVQRRKGHSRDKWDDVKRRYLARLSTESGTAIELEERRSSRWARVGHEWIAITGSREVRQGLWWLGLDHGEFEGRAVRGAIFLCESGDDILAFGFPVHVISGLAPRLDRDRRNEIKFVIRRQRDRYLLRVPGAPDRDITAALGDVAWVAPGSDGPPGSAAAPGGDEVVFFARVHDDRLEPIGSMGLQDGAIVVVRARSVSSAPDNATFRRLLAIGGAPGLPPDFAERHDVYAHGATQ